MADARPDVLDLLQACDAALLAWMHTYAADCCSREERVAAVRRIEDSGGTLAYIARLRERIVAYLAAPEPSAPPREPLAWIVDDPINPSRLFAERPTDAEVGGGTLVPLYADAAPEPSVPREPVAVPAPPAEPTNEPVILEVKRGRFCPHCNPCLHDDGCLRPSEIAKRAADDGVRGFPHAAPAAPAAEPVAPSPSQRMADAGYKRRPSHRALPDDSEPTAPPEHEPPRGLLNKIQLCYSEILQATREVGKRGYWCAGGSEFRIVRGTPYHDGREPTTIDALFNAVYGAEETFKELGRTEPVAQQPPHGESLDELVEISQSMGNYTTPAATPVAQQPEAPPAAAPVDDLVARLRLAESRCDVGGQEELGELLGDAARRIRELEADAARYRHIRDSKHADIAACWILPAGAELAEHYTGDELDAAIDAAIAEEHK